MTALLHRDRRELGVDPAAPVLCAGRVTDDEDVGMTLDAQVAPDPCAPRGIHGEPERRDQGVGAHAGGPHERSGRDHRVVIEANRVGPHLLDRAAGEHLDVARLERCPRVLAE